MTIYGLSQSSGVERRLTIEGGASGVVLTIADHAGGAGRGRVVLAPGSLLPAVTAPAPGGCTLEGTAAPNGARKLLDVEVRRNEVLLRARGEADEGWDVAVGLDDFRDALEGVITA
jgi:hypothetical protein